MGMSASQARLLSLTARLSDLEYTAQNVQNDKIRLADKSEDASKTYQAALNKEKLTVYSSNSSTFIDASAYNLTTYNAVSKTDKQRFIQDTEGRILVNKSIGDAYDDSQNTGSVSQQLKQLYSTVENYLRAILGYSTEAEAKTAGLTYNSNQVAYYTNRYTGQEEFMNKAGYTSNPSNLDPSLTNDSGATVYYGNIFNQIAKNGYNAPGDSKMKDSEWLYSQISAGNIFLTEWNSTGGSSGTGAFVNVSWTSGDASLQVADDKTDLAKAEADYETTQASIEAQDKKFDLKLKELDTEHSAIQTEIDSIKKVIDKNIERSFKTFNA